jgi:hypothetical protein
MTSDHQQFPRRRRVRRIVVPRPDRVRSLDGTAFGWLDARIHHDGWLRVLTPEALAVYTFLCLAADRRGVSFYRRDRIARELGLGDVDVRAALARLDELDLVAYTPFRPGAADGFHQVLSLPRGGPGDALLPLHDLIAKTGIAQR